MRRFLALATLTVCLVAAAPASATVTAVSEPPITKGASNTFWFGWSNVVGGNYSVCFWLSVNGGSFARPAGLSCPGNGGDTGLLAGTSGYVSITLSGLVDGNTYRVCASQKLNGVEGAFECMAPGKTPRVDNSAPEVGLLSVGGEADYTNNPQFPVFFTYADRWSSPWSDRYFGESAFFTGNPANRICVKVAANCTASDTFRTDFAGCNVPQLNRDTVAADGWHENQFGCTLDMTTVSDGQIRVCVQVGDSSVPNNHTTDIHLAIGDKTLVNYSPILCAPLTLDRVAPNVTAAANASSRPTGTPFGFTATASDALSGLDGAVTWAFGDGGTGSGLNPSHAYAAAGTYTATATVKDRAGNTKNASVTVTVTAPTPTPTPTATPTPTPTPTASPTPTPTPTPTPGGGASGGQGGSITQPLTSTQIAQQVGGGSTQSATVGTLSVTAPRKVSLKKSKRKLPLSLATGGPGKVTIVLAKGRKTVSKGSLSFKAAGRSGFTLKVPAKAKTGGYTLTVTFTPASGKPVSKKLTVKLNR